MFGVFDGHGGKFIARKCAEYNWSGERLLEERFWKLDESLGPQSLSSGTTASVMIIECVVSHLYRLFPTFPITGIARMVTIELI